MYKGDWPSTIKVRALPHVELVKSSPDLLPWVHDAMTRGGDWLAGQFGPEVGHIPLEVVKAGLAFTEAQQSAGLSGIYYIRDRQIGGQCVLGSVGIRRIRQAPRIVPGMPTIPLAYTGDQITIGQIGYYRTADAHDLPPLPDGSRRINMTTIAGAVIEQAGRQGLDEANAFIDPANRPSIGVMTRLGAHLDNIRPRLAAAMDAAAIEQGIAQLPYAPDRPGSVGYTIDNVTQYKTPRF